jgi:hypothetical protein
MKTLKQYDKFLNEDLEEKEIHDDEIREPKGVLRTDSGDEDVIDDDDIIDNEPTTDPIESLIQKLEDTFESTGEETVYYNSPKTMNEEIVGNFITAISDEYDVEEVEPKGEYNVYKITKKL